MTTGSNRTIRTIEAQGRDKESHQVFFCISALLFVASATFTILLCRSMSAMGGMRMPGGWTMSMVWMRMPNVTWLGAAAAFFGMWVVMMVAMMLPSLLPMLQRYRQSLHGVPGTHCSWHTLLVGLGYFFVWTLFGVAAYLVGVALTTIMMQQLALARAVPVAAGVIVLIAGLFQFTRCKARHLACCNEGPGSDRTLAPNSSMAWRHGLRLGFHCSVCCAGLMAILLVVGIMNLRAMAVVAAVITIERLAPASQGVVRVVGIFIICVGLFLIARASGIV
jgi:predicted metal-binding membrane protein